VKPARRRTPGPDRAGAATGALVVEPVPCRKDNYAYLVHERGQPEAWIVDPSDPEPPAAALAARGLTLQGILATHHHHDHVGGIDALVDAAPGGGVWVAAHARDRGRVPRQSVFTDAPRGGFIPVGRLIAGRALFAAHVPGHTRGAIAWALADEAGALTDVFTGDTLFGAGCGRLFEGTPAEMLESLRTLAALPPDARLWFGHEYTAANLRFAATIEPENPAIPERQAGLAAITTPTTVALERATNPFVRAASADELGARRAAKERF
jgi:hydroxyacylglutathione hydrolase